MSLPVVLHPDVVDFLRNRTESSLYQRIWNCIEKLRKRQFDGGLRVKKLKGIAKGVWEARITQASRLVFTYEKSRQPDTREPQVYIAVQDICLDHDDVSRRAKARQQTPDAEWLNAEETDESIGSVERDVLTPDEREALDAARSRELDIPADFIDELLGNIQWRILESESEWKRGIIQQDADLPLKLTPEEYELVKLPGNLLLSGSAGTGKTTVALYRLLDRDAKFRIATEDLSLERRLYIAYNPLLVNNAREQFKRIVGDINAPIASLFEFKTLRDLCLDILQFSGRLYNREDEVNFQVFSEMYRAHPKRNQYPTALVWDEIRSIIKGGQLSSTADVLSQKAYEKLGKKRSSVIPQNQRREVYKILDWYQKKLKKSGGFDEIDLAREVLKVIKLESIFSYKTIVCDEVQDFTELQLELLFQLIDPDGKLFFAGDLHQMISPSGFRWEELKQKFYPNRTVEQKTLAFNFRSVGTLVNLANQVLQLRFRLLKEPIGDISHPAVNYGKVARLIHSTSDSLVDNLQKTSLNPGESILVRTDTDKEKLRTKLNSSFVFTVEEAKGLEFDTVFLLEFFKPAEELWGKVLRGGLLKEKETPQLQLELNLLYVAITRARRILNIWESTPSEVWKQEELAASVQSMMPESVRSDREQPTPESWREQGLYYLKGEFYQQAIECFEKAGDILLEKQTNAKLLTQQREYEKAANIWLELQQWEEAAQLFEKLENWKEAATCWANVGDTQKQQMYEIYALEAAKEWEEAARKWEALDREDDAKRCWMKIPQKKAEYKAIEYEQQEKWLKAAGQYHIAGLPEKALECRVKEYEKRKEWNLAAREYEKGGYLEKARECRKYGADSWLASGLAKHCKGLEKSDRSYIENAIEDFTESLRIEPNSAQAYYNRGLAHSQLGNLKQALEDYNFALELNQNYAEAYNNRGNARCQLGELEKAIADLNKALELNPNYSDAYYHRGLALAEKGDINGAIADYNKALELNRYYGKAYNYRGLARMKIGDLTGAIADFNEALRINPQYADAYRNLTAARAALKDTPEAISDFTPPPQITRHIAQPFKKPDSLGFQFEEILEKMTDFSEVMQINPRIAKTFQKSPPIRLKFEEITQAIGDRQPAIEGNPEEAEGYRKRGDVRVDRGDYSGALADYNQSLKFNPDRADTYNVRGFVRYKLGDTNGAIADFNKAVELTPNFAIAYLIRGLAFTQIGDDAGAIQDHTQALNINPNFADAYYQRGHAYRRLGQIEKARQDFEKAAELYQEESRPSDRQNALNALENL